MLAISRVFPVAMIQGRDAEVESSSPPFVREIRLLSLSSTLHLVAFASLLFATLPLGIR